jgi:hypothetical protein
MADVSAIFGILLMLAIVFPGLMFTVWLLFPDKVSQAEMVLGGAKWRALGVGILSLAVLLAPVMVLLNAPAGGGQFLGWALIAASLTLASVGAAGIGLRMGRQLSLIAGGGMSTIRSFLGGVVALELAAAFPVIGWFLVIPGATLFGLGAAVLAMFRWSPRVQPAPAAGSALASSLSPREA